VFDVEDYVTPPEGGMDDLLKMLADVMTEEKVSGSFFIIGEKLRCIRDRGRSDVIAALACHDVGSHVNMGSIHPSFTERMEKADWTDGIARAAAEELAGVDELSAIIGQPLSSLARHGGSYSPQLLAMLGSRSLAYVYSPSRLPGHHITWFCNALNFYHAFTMFQTAYLSRAAFLEAEKEFFASVAEYRDCEWVAIFHSHPCMIKVKQFGCMNYYNGIHTPPEEWMIPEPRPEFSIDTVRDNWGFHCARLRDNPGIMQGTIADFAQEFGDQAESATAEEIKFLAGMAAEAQAPCWTDRFSAGEILDLLARALLHHAAQGELPGSLPRRNVFGPTQMPLAAPTARQLLPEALQRVARGIAVAVDATGTLPSRIRCGEGIIGSPGEIGTGSAMVALGQALASGNLSAPVKPKPFKPYPPEGDEIADTVRTYRSWRPHRPDLDMSQLCLLSALQAWTLKPAWPGGPPEFSM